MIRALRESVIEWLLGRGVHLRRVGLFERLLIREIRRDSPVQFVQVGANDGVSFDNLYWLVTQYGMHGLVVEPLQDVFALLKHNYREFPVVKPVRVALHPTLEQVTLHRVNPARIQDHSVFASGIASVLPEWHRTLNIPMDDMMQENVPAVHLMKLLDDHNIQRLHLLQTDVEGFDAEVIKMLDFSRIKPRIIKFEARAAGSDSEVTELLRRNGYVVAREGPDIVAWVQ